MGLHAVARVAAVVGAVGSVALTLYAGRNNNLPFLMILMSGWVFAPFFGYAVASRVSARWSAFTRAALDATIIVIAVGSLAIYGNDVLRPPAAKAAKVYVVVPGVSWVLLLVGVPIAAFIARRRRTVQAP